MPATLRSRMWSRKKSAMKWKASSWPKPLNTFISSSHRLTLWISTKSYLIPRHTLCGEPGKTRCYITTDYEVRARSKEAGKQEIGVLETWNGEQKRRTPK